MTREDFRIAGEMCKETSWSDDALIKVIHGLECTIAFLQGRKDAGIIVSKLRMEQSLFVDIQENRRRKKK